MQAVDHFCERNILSFTHYLRSQNFNVSLSEASDCIQALTCLDNPDKKLSLNIFRALYCQNINDWQTFDPLFYQFWYNREFIASRKIQSETNTGVNPSNNLTGFSGSSDSLQYELNTNTRGSGAGKQNTLSKADFRFIKDREAMRKMESLAEKLAIEMGPRRNSFQITRSQRQQIDVRRTIRSNLSDPFLLFNRLYKEYKYKPPQLIVFHDVSHSMTWNNPLLFRFARGLVKHFKDSHAFVFHTDLFQVTEIYKLQSLTTMREKLEQNNNLWLGGTSIASSLEKYVRNYMPDIQKKHSLVLILSDGFDTDTSEHLASVLEKIRYQSDKIFWLSPMLSNPAYNPDNTNLKSAKKYLDGLLPCSSLHHLEQATSFIKSKI